MTIPAQDLARRTDVAVVTGASGLIGSRLVPKLVEQGFMVRRLVRRESRRRDEFTWDPQSGAIDTAALEGADVVINLAGETIGRRWTAGRRQRIRDSRVKGTSLLVTTIGRVARPPRAMYNASAMGIYGSRGAEVLDETSTHGSDFLASVCEEWEAATDPAAAAGVRVVIGRHGLVLAPEGGALGQMLPVFRLGLGGRLGAGRQWVSWIALADVVRAILFLLSNDVVAGPLNVVAPNPVDNTDFTRALGAVLRRPTVFPVPTIALTTIFGEMATHTLLASQRVRPTRLLELGFEFRYPTVEAALRGELHAGGV
jgi:uncharacterized protein (TIGR01777 family)